MSQKLEDYALIGDSHTVALVGRDGCIDWFCCPRFDSAALFSSLLGTDENGFWSLAPAGGIQSQSRRYIEDTLVLETVYETDTGSVAVIDFMPMRAKQPDLARIVEGRRGTVNMAMECKPRFDYGSQPPWIEINTLGMVAIAGPDAVILRTPLEVRRNGHGGKVDFVIMEGQRIPFVLTWFPSHESPPPAIDPENALKSTEANWKKWSKHCTHQGEWRQAVQRSLITLKALTYAPTGGLVAAPTTSLPESIGGKRNWDYRFCWLRDATFTLYALMSAGYEDEARAWREWLVRAVAGNPADVQIMYGLSGERRLTELELPWLSGYEGSKPVRIGNAAHEQFQLDVFGEVMDALHYSRRMGMREYTHHWKIQRELLDFLESKWNEPDDSLWEVRGGKRHFTHSKVMAWVAMDRAVQAVELFDLDGPADRWREIRAKIQKDVFEKGYDPAMGSFVQSYGSKELDSALLVMPQVGFIDANDPRFLGTLAAIERTLMSKEGFVARYTNASQVDGVDGEEGTFLLCTFWLADAYALCGRITDARRIFERLLSIRNDVGLLAEEYDPKTERMIGNFPQAFSHIGLINTANNIVAAEKKSMGPAHHRQQTAAQSKVKDEYERVSN